MQGGGVNRTVLALLHCALYEGFHGLCDHQQQILRGICLEHLSYVVKRAQIGTELYWDRLQHQST